jgi:hypothetical protein
MIPSGRRARILVALVLLGAVLVGCGPTVAGRSFDRCHRGERERERLYFELLCVETP